MVVIHGSSCKLKTRRYAMAAASDTRIVGFGKAIAHAADHGRARQAGTDPLTDSGRER
jgi:hypothetical protein